MVEISKRDWKLFREKLPKSDMLIDLVRLVQDKVIGLEISIMKRYYFFEIVVPQSANKRYKPSFPVEEEQ